ADVTLPESPRHPPPSPLPSPECSEPMVFSFFDEAVGYHTAVEVRIARGEWGRGRCAAWLRPSIPLIDGEVLSPLQAVAITADALNGIAMVLDSRHYAFVNPDMTIALLRAPRSCWVGMDARGVATPHGVGMNEGRLYDEDGDLGRVLQSLVVRAQR
ncbi:MAG: thioesterase family protein, partial [Nannocystaceae bacterium]|nr:thioesterase family protein [Nannocystaceae bacterium]